MLLEPQTSHPSQPSVGHAVRTISVTLVTGSADILIGDALKSVSTMVDACLVVYSSSVYSPGRTLAAAAEAVGDKLVVHEIPSGGLGVMLNGSMALARQIGAEWAILLGPDENVFLDGYSDMQKVVADAISSGVKQHNCNHSNLEYSKVGLPWIVRQQYRLMLLATWLCCSLSVVAACKAPHTLMKVPNHTTWHLFIN
jgi:hypothetical protein